MLFLGALVAFCALGALIQLWKLFVPQRIYPRFSAADSEYRRFWRPHVHHNAKETFCQVIWWTGVRYVKYVIDLTGGEFVMFAPVRSRFFKRPAIQYHLFRSGIKSRTIGAPFLFGAIGTLEKSETINVLPEDVVKSIQKARRILGSRFPNGVFENCPYRESWRVGDPSPWLRGKAATG